MKNLCSGSQCGGFQFLLILDLWGISFHAVVVIGLGKNFLFKSALGHCGSKLPILFIVKCIKLSCNVVDTTILRQFYANMYSKIRFKLNKTRNYLFKKNMLFFVLVCSFYFYEIFIHTYRNKYTFHTCYIKIKLRSSGSNIHKCIIFI